MGPWRRSVTRAVATAVLFAGLGTAANAQAATETVATTATFSELQERLTKAVEASGMFVVTRACASCGAARRGVTIRGNAVFGVFRNDFAVRMLEASVPAGIEAPIRFYITENDDGTASLGYRMPSAVFAPYGSADLDLMAQDLDRIWRKIIDDTLGG